MSWLGPSRRRTGRAARGSRRACPCPCATSNSASAYTRAISSIGLVPLLRGPVAGQGREVDLGQRLLDQPLVVVVVERLAGHLLGREHGQVGDLLADLLQRAPRLGLDVLARGGDQLLALGLALGRRLGDRGLRRPCGRGRRCRRPARAPPSAAGGTRRAARRPPRAGCSAASMFSRIALARFSSASPIRGKANLLEHEHRDPEQRSASRSSARARARPGSCRPPPRPRARPVRAGRTVAMSPSSSIARPRGRRRSGRR